ncbi:MAG: division/cell wall cluster transcriptional repressor MraZ [Bacteroidaceae bacterium]|nr:division/cell wall cluster transcriptional repressor MraZ [Bacteroidaceae bacterium]
MRFTGDYLAKTDAKGRVFLPAAFRKMLEQYGEQQLVLRPNMFQHCLDLYPGSVWNLMLDSLNARLDPWNGTHQALKRNFVAKADIIELDNSGRLLISKNKMQYAFIKQDVRFLAVDDHFEVWDKDTCEAVLNQLTPNGEPEGLAYQQLMSGFNG